MECNSAACNFKTIALIPQYLAPGMDFYQVLLLWTCLLQVSRARISHQVIALLEAIAFVAKQICNLRFALENVLGAFKIMQNDVF
jgi:hypothetical protein